MSFLKYKLNAVKLCICFTIGYFMAQGQVKYSNDSSYINTLTNTCKNNLEKFNYNRPDTTVNNFHNYYPRNSSGNIGLPSAPLFLKYDSRPLGFQLYHAPYDNDMISNDQVKYYQTKGPYANLTGIAGSKQEQMFKMVFAHTFKNKLNLAIALNRYGSLGFYKRQQSFTNSLYTSSNYTSKSGRVGYYAYFLFNKVKHQENGGIKNDTFFLENVRINKQLLPVNLSAAKREVRYSTIEVNPWFRLNKTEDSSTVFSHFIEYKLNYSGNYTKYVDAGIATDNFYRLFYLDTLKTFDSTHWQSISNAAKYTLKINPLHTGLQIGYKNEYNRVHQYRDSVFMNNSVNAGLFFNTNTFNGFAKADYIFQGSNKDDYALELGGRYLQKLKVNGHKVPIVFNLKAGMEKRHPDFIYNTMYSNNFVWNNNFSPTDKVQAQFNISTADSRFDMGVLVQNINNQLYFDQQARPQQTSVSIQNFSFFIKKDLLLFKHLGLNAGYVYQKSSYEAIVSVPNNSVSGALYYEGDLFKKALQIQIGFSGQYFSEFLGYNYMPATNSYYVQTSKVVGNYPYVDFFLNARIKPVRIFVKVDHITQGFLGHNYSLQPGYLQSDRAFKFGVNWIFFD